MIRATYSDKSQVIDILTQSFNDNRSVNYIIKQDRKREQRIKALMNYSFDVCYSSGCVYISNDKNACALISFPDKKRTTLYSILSSIKFIFSCLGVSNIKKAMSREAAIKKIHPNDVIYYLWFIGVKPSVQGKGLGLQLMNEIINDGKAMKRVICLETSTVKNIPWYEKFGFKIYKELDFGYKLYCMKRE